MENVNLSIEISDADLNELEMQRKALKYICKGKGWGYLKDFTEKFGIEMVNMYKSLGYIKCGISPNERENEDYAGTWEKTSNAKRALKLIANPSFFDKILCY